MVGLPLAATPLGIGLEVAGGVTSLIGAGFKEFGDEESKKSKDKAIVTKTGKQVATTQSQKVKETGSSATAGGYGASAQFGGSASELIQSSGSF